jgi:hypothetical protein
LLQSIALVLEAVNDAKFKRVKEMPEAGALLPMLTVVEEAALVVLTALVVMDRDIYETSRYCEGKRIGAFGNSRIGGFGGTGNGGSGQARSPNAGGGGVACAT